MMVMGFPMNASLARLSLVYEALGVYVEGGGRGVGAYVVSGNVVNLQELYR